MTLYLLLMGPTLSALPLPRSSPEQERVSALAAFALFDLSVITPLYGDHTTKLFVK